MLSLARTLLLADAVSHDALSQALLVSARDGGSFVRALIATGALDAGRLARHLERGDAPYMHQVAPVVSLVEGLPAGLCERLMALPVRRDPMTGTVDVAVVDARDSHPVREMAYWLSAPVRMVHTSLAAMESALQRLAAKPERGMRSLAPPIGQLPADEPTHETPRYGNGPPAPDLALAEHPVAIIELGPPAIERVPTRDSDRPAPPTVRGPFLMEPGLPGPVEETAGSTVRGPHLDAGDAVRVRDSDPPGAHGIRAARDRDDILEGLVAGVRFVARRVGVFAVRRDGLVGWTCSPELADRATFRSLRWAPSARTILRTALATRGVSLVRIPGDALHTSLAEVVGPPAPHEVALASVHVEDKGIALVLADDIDDALVAAERLQGLVRVAGECLELLLRERRERRDGAA